MRHILDVLIDNALDHGAGAVMVRARAAPGGLAVEVADEGPGIPGDPVSIFQRRGANARGNGIGLALARSLAEGEGGRLYVARATPAPIFVVLLQGLPSGEEGTGGS
jgi:signal transduction histidine kinase